MTAALVAASGLTALAGPAAPAAAEPSYVYPGLVSETLITGANVPVAARVAPGGRIYVAEKRGVVNMYDAIGDTTPQQVIDIQSQVHDFWDRGLLGLAVDPGFPSRPYLYLLYAYDRDPFGDTTVPRWGDDCPDPPGGTEAGCTVSARLIRIAINPVNGLMTGEPPLLLLDGAQAGAGGGWCMQYPSHTIGTLAFGPSGALYVGAGDGASFNFADWGQHAGNGPTPANPCNDGPGSRGTALSSPTARGGALRAQAARFGGSYTSWDGAILRINPDTGAAFAGNPLIGTGSVGDDRIVAYGLRNPFRFSVRPHPATGQDQLWLGDVGWSAWEEVNTFTFDGTTVPNFGWPCYEGDGPMSAYDGANLDVCETLYANPTQTIGVRTSPLVLPYYRFVHLWNPGDIGDRPDPTNCPVSDGTASVTGGPFVTNPLWPVSVRGAYVFADYSQGCIFAKPVDGSGQPTGTPVTLARGVGAVDLQVGPDGNLWYVDIYEGAVVRLRSPAAPIARLTANPTSGALPLTVTWDASASTDDLPNAQLSFSWDLDNNGTFGDGGLAGPTATTTYAVGDGGPKTVRVLVSDSEGFSSIASFTIQAGLPPSITALTAPPDFGAGETLTASGSATDPDGGPLPSSAFEWRVDVLHCGDDSASTACHVHPGAVPATAGTSLSFVAPDHEWFAKLAVTLTVTDSDGNSSEQTAEIVPRRSDIVVLTDPPGIVVDVGPASGPAPVSAPFIEGGLTQVIASAEAMVGGVKYKFVGWSDQPAAPAIRELAAPPGGITLTARYAVDQLAVPAGPAGRYLPLPPMRVLDTRDGTGASVGKIAAGNAVTLAVRGVAGVPADASAVVLNVTATEAGRDGYVTVSPCGAGTPGVSNLNYVAGQTVPNLVTVPVAGDGTVCLFTYADTHLVADVAGAFSPAGDRFTGQAPVRVLDTRDGTGGGAATPLPAGQELVLPLVGGGAVPGDATGAVLNVTVTAADGPGYLSVYPCGTPPPNASNLNFVAGQTVPNLVLATLGGGSACIVASARTHVVADLAGWFAPAGASFVPAAPVRLVDTRAVAPVATGGVLAVPIVDLGVPASATAVVVNLTATEPVAAGYLTAYPCGQAPPLASNVNYLAGQSVPNLVTVAVGAGGSVCVASYRETHVLVDLQGWFT